MDTYLFFGIAFTLLSITTDLPKALNSPNTRFFIYLFIYPIPILMHSLVMHSTVVQRHCAQRCVKHCILLVNLVHTVSQVNSNL